MDWSPHVPPPEGRGLGGLFLMLVFPSAPAPLCNCCRKVLAPRTNPTSCYLMSSHRTVENLAAAAGSEQPGHFYELSYEILGVSPLGRSRQNISRTMRIERGAAPTLHPP